MTSLHNPLISALTTFYTLLVDLRYIPASTLILPSPQTQRHPRNSINHHAAAQNGFSKAAVQLACRLPYVTDEDYRLNYDTRSLCYLARVPNASGGNHDDDEAEAEAEVEGEGEDAWEFARDPTFQDRSDLWTETITEWKHFEDPEAWQTLSAIPMTSPQNPLYVWIRAFLTLQNIPFDDDILIPRKPEELGYPGNRADEEEMRARKKRVEDAERERGLKDVYVRCGWKIDTVMSVSVPVWEALEEARQRAGEGFRGEGFEQCKEEWKEGL
ncbi:hypothetical protein UA08_07964 [Talaromyces atroroseus]|uniref:Uncharacterized protein n=1 Tax=Talaromyces atroroseus TaxID=1441469 RepID=A0A225AMK8_TALAT|nr:hypothetical protein UA08_07964 [Talaromyces atroroseus]OKL56819.1 hypothetical protein UA08_07964 [Talaromyces atroroseus]